jgi:hypothetical protein
VEAPILSGKGVLAVNKELVFLVERKNFLENGFVCTEFESYWEKKTGLQRREWHKWE